MRLINPSLVVDPPLIRVLHDFDMAAIIIFVQIKSYLYIFTERFEKFKRLSCKKQKVDYSSLFPPNTFNDFIYDCNIQAVGTAEERNLVAF